MVNVEFNNKTQNPFYGMRYTLEIFQNGSKGLSINERTLDNALQEAKTIEQKALLMSVLFSIGDVSGRQHNIFGYTVENGGNSQREVFRDNILPFVWKSISSDLNPNSMLRLFKLISEYTTMDNLFASRVITKKGKKTILGKVDMISLFGVDNLSSYASNIILNGSTFEKMCLAKFLKRPRLSKRSGNKEIQSLTLELMNLRNSLLKAVSDKSKLAYEDKGSYTNFFGYYNWRREFIQNNEYVLFSEKIVKELDKEEFFKLLETSPSDARFRIRNRVLFDEEGKWGDLGSWYKEWEKFKETKQAEQRQIEKDIEDNGATESKVEKLREVKKSARVNTGAISFEKMFKEIVNGTIEKVKVQPFLDKINLPYNTLVFGDDSGSMNSTWGNNYGFTPRQFAAFMATICLSNNPDPEARDLIGLFSNNCRMFNGVTKKAVSKNSILNSRSYNIPKEPLINKEDHFLDNLKRMKQFFNANSQGMMTNVSSIPEDINKWVQGDPQKIEQLQRFPVWTLISDGNFNNLSSSEASMNDFLRRCENYFGFKPFIILIDVAGGNSSKITRFSGIDNMMVVPPNPAAIELFLTNFKDMDTYDVYTPLLSISRSKRYIPIRNFVETLSKVESLQGVDSL